jgi:hypothetical protein
VSAQIHTDPLQTASLHLHRTLLLLLLLHR